MIQWTKVVDCPVPDTHLKEDGSKASPSDLLPDKGPDGELAWGSNDKGLALKKDELCSSCPQVKWFNASVLLKTDSLKAHAFKGEETTLDHLLLKLLPVIRCPELDATHSSTVPWEWPRTPSLPSQPSHWRSRLRSDGIDTAGTSISPVSALGNPARHRNELRIAQSLGLPVTKQVIALDTLPRPGRPRFSRQLSLVRQTWPRASSTIRQDAIVCPGAAQ